MTPRILFHRLLCTGLVLVGAAAYAADAPAPAARPNIVFVLVDDAGFSDFGAYGSEIATPNIDKIAQSGVRFTNFHTASTCESTRTMLQSGVDHHRAGAGTLQVTIADNQRGKPGYEGYLSDNVYSLGQLLHDGGYATYFAGKWNIGEGLARSPGARGWDRYISLEQTGADNYEDKVYAPFNLEAKWWEDGHRAQLPPDFYSSDYYADKLMQYIGEGRANGKPFMAMLSFQAVHSPLQAPAADVDKYLAHYTEGWDKVRAERYQRQVRMGIVPAGLSLPPIFNGTAWKALGDEDKRLYTKRMAVFAGMMDHADQEVGRLRDYLRQAGQLDNTVFIVMSDNGGDAFDLSQLNLPFRAWYQMNYALGIDSMGGRGSYTHYGPDWAAVSNTPFRLVKGTSNEGGMRVPFIIQYPGKIKPGSQTSEFAYVTDFVPTVLDIAGIPLPDGLATGDGKPRIAPMGTSVLPFLEGKTSAIHSRDQPIGFEGTGGQALFLGDYKLLRNGIPFGDGHWQLYHLSDDPTESNDLSAQQPALVKQMLAQVAAYNQKNGVVLPGPGYDPLRQVLVNNWRVLLRQMWWVAAAALAIPLALLAAIVVGVRRWRRSLQLRAA